MNMPGKQSTIIMTDRRREALVMARIQHQYTGLGYTEDGCLPEGGRADDQVANTVSTWKSS